MDVTVSCAQGDITGVEQDGIRYFHSIAYSVILSDFEYAQPRPAATIDARTPAPDKVALSITAPGSGNDHPVIVYIHGGAFDHGTHEDPRVQGTELARQGIMTVNIDYRLGFPGLATFPEEEPGHYRAIDDCSLALEWIQHNIEAFGGDPTSVTVVGHSAGAAIALWLCRRDHYKGAFRRVVALSPAFPRKGWEERRKVFRRVTFHEPARRVLEAMSTDHRQRIYRRMQPWCLGDMVFGPYPLDPGENAEVDIIVSTARDEFSTNSVAHAIDRSPLCTPLTYAWARRMSVAAPTKSWVDRVRKRGTQGLFSQLIGDSCVRRHAQLVADCAPGRVWMAELVGTPEEPAFHSKELELLFNRPEHRLHQWLADLAHTGNPGWPEYHPHRETAVLNVVTGKAEVLRDPLQSVRLGFEGITQ